MRVSRWPVLFAGCLCLLQSGCNAGPSKNKGKLESTSWGSEETSYRGFRVPSGHLKLYFKADGRMVYHIGAEAYSGRYEYGPGKIVVFHLDRELAGSKSHSEEIWFEGEKLMVSDTFGPRVGFRRLR